MYYFEYLPVGIEADFGDEYHLTDEKLIELGRRCDPRRSTSTLVSASVSGPRPAPVSGR